MTHFPEKTIIIREDSDRHTHKTDNKKKNYEENDLGTQQQVMRNGSSFFF